MKKVLIWVVVLAVVVFVAFRFLIPSGVVNEGYTDLSAEEAKGLLDNNLDVVVIDVSPHYDFGHIPGAMNYYPPSNFDAVLDDLDKEKTYLVYCHVDSASIAAAEKMVEAGFENVYRLEGNYMAWAEKNYPMDIVVG